MPLNPTNQLEVGLSVESESIWEDEWRPNAIVARDYFKHQDVD